VFGADSADHALHRHAGFRHIDFEFPRLLGRIVVINDWSKRASHARVDTGTAEGAFASRKIDLGKSTGADHDDLFIASLYAGAGAAT